MRIARIWTLFVAGALFYTAAYGQNGPPAAGEPAKVTVNIDRQAVREALRVFGEQTGVQVLFRSEGVTTKGVTSQRVVGQFSPQEALERLLSNTGLKYEFVNAHTVRISSARAPSVKEAVDPDPSASYSPGNQRVDGDKSSSPSKGEVRGEDRNTIQEIIVTAQKKSERLQDVPVPVTVLNAETLAERGQSRLQDYFAEVPGLSMSSAAGGIGGSQTIAIRGITSGDIGNPTVGITIDDVPYGSSNGFGFGEALVPVIDPSDLSRIEVLRGPQGTLYGASSIGGLVKFVTVDPTTQAFSGRVQMLGDTVAHGGSGYSLRAAANVPLSDDIAVRASGFTRVDPGYIDNVLTGQTDVNRVKAYGGLLSTLWSPSDAFSLKINALLQNTEGDGTSAIDWNSQLRPVYGYLKQARLPGAEGYDTRLALYTATLKAKLGELNLVSISGYGDNRYFQTLDLSQGFGYFATQPPFNLQPNVAGASNRNDFETKKFTQEVRLSSASGNKLEWLAGFFYAHEHSASDQTIFANNLTTGVPLGQLIDFSYPTTVAEYAAFGDLTAHFTDRFDVQFGARESHIDQVYNETDTGPLVPAFYLGLPSPFYNPTERTRANAFTYLVTPRFRIDPNLMVYARLTSGYRLGGPNTNAVVYQIPPEVAPDKTNNYEVGIKGELWEHKLTFDAAAYYTAWKKIQIALTNSTGSAVYSANGGNARSQGLEFSMMAKPLPGTSVGVSASLNDAQLTQDLPSSSTALGVEGDRLPFSSRFSGALSVDQDFTITGSVIGFVGGSLVYVGAREGNFAPTYAPVRLEFPSYTQADFRAGVRYASWTANLFARNAFDRRGITSGGTNSGESPFYAVYIQPRTIGLSIAKAF